MYKSACCRIDDGSFDLFGYMNDMAWAILSYLLLLSCCYLTQACQEGAPCNSTTVPKGLCIRGTCMADIPNWDRQNLTFTITVKYPEDTLRMHGGSELYLIGNGIGFNWNKGTVIPKTSADTWSIQVVYRSSVAGYSCQTCADQAHVIHKQFEYRVLVDDRVDMIGANFAVELPVSEVSSYFTTVKEFMAFPWFYHHQGNVSAVTVKSNELGGDRSIALYTPPSFDENVFKVYPVIYALDYEPVGTTIPQHLFDDTIAKYGASEEFIVIGFGNYTSLERHDFLTPTRSQNIQLCKNGSFADKCNGCFSVEPKENFTEYLHLMATKCGQSVLTGGQGDDVLDFLHDTVYPVIQTKCNNRLSTDRENIGIMGYSLGGLMSCHAAWTRPHQFGFAACQSSSFWYPYKHNQGVVTAEFELLNVTMNNETLKVSRPPQRIYIDVGGVEDAAPVWMVRAAIDVADKFTKLDGYELDRNVWVSVYAYSDHTFVEWQIRIWKTLKTLLPAKGMPRMPSTQIPGLIG